MNNILVFPSSDGEQYSGYIRSFLPAKVFNNKYKKTKMVCSLIFKDDDTSHTIVLNRQCTDRHTEIITNFLKHKKLIYSLDDNIFEIPKYNNASAFYDVYKQSNILKIIDMSKFLIVQNKYFKKYCSEKFDIPLQKIKVIENKISKDIWGDKKVDVPFDFKSKPTILYAGSQSYCEDFKFLLPIIKKTQDKYNWIVVGVSISNYVYDVNVHNLPWIKMLEYPAKLKELNPDIVVFPKINNVFNKSRSSARVFEASALNVPIICTKFDDGWKEPYASITRPLNTQVWENEIEKLISNKDYYNRIIRKQQLMLEKNWLEDYIPEYYKVLATK